MLLSCARIRKYHRLCFSSVCSELVEVRRRLMTTKTPKAENFPALEVSFKVPWGHISGKSWGPSNGYPVLALHGWLDNAGTFDGLIPLLPHDLCTVAIDFPGHGLSSPRCEGDYYHFVNMIADVNYVIKSLGWTKFSIIAHSMGAGVASMFAGAFPNLVERMILLEGLGPYTMDPKLLPVQLGKAVLQLETFAKKPEKVYPTWDAAISRIVEGNPNLTRDSAEVLAVRGTAPVENGYIFTRDLRLKGRSLMYLTEDVFTAFARSIECPILAIIAEQSLFPKEVIEKRAVLLKQVKVSTVQGNHHVHLNNPAVVAPLVSEYLQPVNRLLKSEL